MPKRKGGLRGGYIITQRKKGGLKGGHIITQNVYNSLKSLKLKGTVIKRESSDEKSLLFIKSDEYTLRTGSYVS